MLQFLWVDWNLQIEQWTGVDLDLRCDYSVKCYALIKMLHVKPCKFNCNLHEILHQVICKISNLHDIWQIALYFKLKQTFLLIQSWAIVCLFSTKTPSFLSSNHLIKPCNSLSPINNSILNFMYFRFPNHKETSICDCLISHRQRCPQSSQFASGQSTALRIRMRRPTSPSPPEP